MAEFKDPENFKNPAWSHSRCSQRNQNHTTYKISSFLFFWATTYFITTSTLIRTQLGEHRKKLQVVARFWTPHDWKRTSISTSKELFIATPLMVEALAVREALLQAKAFHLSNICLKSDSQMFVKALNSKQLPMELHRINLDIENISSSFSSITFAYVHRGLNSAADALAKTALFSLNS